MCLVVVVVDFVCLVVVVVVVVCLVVVVVVVVCLVVVVVVGPLVWIGLYLVCRPAEPRSR